LETGCTSPASLYVTGLSSAPNLDLTPFAFLLSGAAIYWGLVRFRFLDIVPVARDALIEGMDHGVVVVDTEGRVVDPNPAARRILGLPSGDGVTVGDTLRRLAPSLAAMPVGAFEHERAEVRLG
jgi:PAS domain-containing protein